MRILALILFLNAIPGWGASLAYQSYSKGVELAARREYAAAVEKFKEAIDLNPSYIASYVECARAQVMLGKRPEGLAELKEAVAIAKRKEDRDRILRERGALSEVFYTNATFQNYQNGLNYLRLDRSNSALESFEKAYAVEPDNMLVLLGYARALDAEDNQKLRLEILEKAYALNETNRDARLALADSLLTSDAPRAYELLRFVPSDRSVGEDAVVLYTRVLLALKRRKEGLDFLRDRSEKHPTWIVSQFWLGKIYATETGGAWLARKHLMTFLKRVEPLMQSENSKAWKNMKIEADAYLTQVNKSLD